MHESAVIICHQSLTGVLQWPLTFLELSCDLRARSLELIQSDQLFLFVSLTSNFFPSLHAWLDCGKSPGCFQTSFLSEWWRTLHSRRPSVRQSSFLNVSQICALGMALSGLRRKFFSDLLIAWLNLNLGEQKSQRWSRLNEENTISVAPEPNKTHHIGCFHRCEADSFARETFHFSLS